MKDLKALEGEKMSDMATQILEESLGKIVLVRLRGGKKFLMFL